MPDLTALQSLDRRELGSKESGVFTCSDSNKTDSKFDKVKLDDSSLITEPSLRSKYDEEAAKLNKLSGPTAATRLAPKSAGLEKLKRIADERLSKLLDLPPSKSILDRKQILETGRREAEKSWSTPRPPKYTEKSTNIANIKPQSRQSIARPVSPVRYSPAYQHDAEKLSARQKFVRDADIGLQLSIDKKESRASIESKPVETVSVPVNPGAPEVPKMTHAGMFTGPGGPSEHGEYSRRGSGGGNGSHSGAGLTTHGATSTSGESQAGGRILIKGGSVVNEDTIAVADVYVEDGIIKEVAPNLRVPSGVQTIDATGKYVMPGGIDPHTHFKLQFFGATSVDDFETGTKAAVAGGTTMIIDFIMAYKNDSLLQSYEKYRTWADPNVCCDYGLSTVVSHVNDKIKNEMTELVRSKGINSFKFFMAYHNILQISDTEFYDGLVHCRKLGALARVHAENGDLIAMKQKELLALGITGPEGHIQSRPEEAAEEATYRACLLAREANCPLYVVHIMSQGSSEAVERARRKGAIVFGEGVSAALASIDGANVYDHCWHVAAAHVITPPLSADRTTGDRLLDALACDQMQLTGSDHAVFDSSQKALGKQDFTKIPTGAMGAEERMMVVWQKGVNSGKMDPMRFVAITSSTAAKLFNIYPKKGRIAPQSDADIVVWDPEARHTISAKTHHSKADLNIFEGIECVGCPVITICGGRIVYENGQVNAEARGQGRFVALPPFAPLAFATVSRREKCRLPIKVDRTTAASASVAAVVAAAAASGNGLPAASSSSRTSASTTPASGVTSPMSPFVNDVDALASAIGGGGSDDKFAYGLRVTSPSAAASATDFHSRPATRSGGRNLLDSSFTLSGAQIDDEQASRRSTKISKPPGGESRGLW